MTPRPIPVRSIWYTLPMNARAVIATCCVLIGTLLVQSALAQTGYPIPRFVSLKSDRTNLRSGPGERYPVKWVFLYRGMPVKIVREHEHWRQVVDWEGTKGWIHRQLLSGTQTVLIKENLQPLRKDPSRESKLVARVEKMVIGTVLNVQGDWCHIDIHGYRGWMLREHVWGILESN